MDLHHMCIPFSVDGNPTPSIQWRFEGRDLVETEFVRTKILPTDDYGNSTVVHGCLNLNRPTHFSNGNYTLLVSNALGSDSRTIYQKFMDVPDSFPEEDMIGTGLGPGAHPGVPGRVCRGVSLPTPDLQSTRLLLSRGVCLAQGAFLGFGGSEGGQSRRRGRRSSRLTWEAASGQRGALPAPYAVGSGPAASRLRGLDEVGLGQGGLLAWWLCLWSGPANTPLSFPVSCCSSAPDPPTA